ncbi:MAG: hypothetical protein ACFE7S_08945 [Candidatus Hodarchaeota archaeon]
MTQARFQYNADILLFMAAILGLLILMSNSWNVNISSNGLSSYSRSIIGEAITINIIMLILGFALITLRMLRSPKPDSKLSTKLALTALICSVLLFDAMFFCIPIFSDILPFVFWVLGSYGGGIVEFSIGVYLSIIYLILIMVATILVWIDFVQTSKG